MMPALVGALLFITLLPRGSVAASDPAETACHWQPTTITIMECLEGLTRQWDTRLNTAYQAVLNAAEPQSRKDALLRAERAWLAYRTANCDWYDTHEGTIRKVLAAECMLHMTEARATELEQALKP